MMVDFPVGFEDVEKSISLLSLEVEKAIHPMDALEKSMYSFTFTTVEGVQSFLELLPVLDESIIKEVYSEIFPGYPTNTLPMRVARVELEGYLKDYLANAE